MKPKLLREVVMTFIHPDSRAQIQAVLTKFDNDPLSSLLSGMENIQLFTGSTDQKYAGSAITGMILGILLSEGADIPEVEKMLKEFCNFEKPDNVVSIKDGRKFDA